MSGIPAGAGSLLGKRLGKYEILALLALGGTAEIYLARIGGAAGFEKYVVVKCLHDHLADDQEFVKMFLDEARLAAHLDHSNIVQTMELGEHENRYFMVMEFLAGMSLAMIVRRAGERLPGGMIPVPLALNIVAQACAGLHYAHERAVNGKLLNIVHRDISPQNLVVSFEGVVKVVDFGIAKAELRETKTKSGTIKGKFAYMSPEQCIAANVDRRTDVFALGVITHELLTGQRLFKRPSPYETYQAVMDCNVQPPSKINIQVDPALDAVIMKAVAKDKDKRYPTAEAFGDALLGYLHHRGKGSGPGDVSRFFDASFSQEIEEHSARMRELISGEDQSLDAVTSWGEEDDKRRETVDLGGRGRGSAESLNTSDLEMASRDSMPAVSGAIGEDDIDEEQDDEQQPAEKTRIEANPLELLKQMNVAAAAQPTPRPTGSIPSLVRPGAAMPAGGARMTSAEARGPTALVPVAVPSIPPLASPAATARPAMPPAGPLAVPDTPLASGQASVQGLRPSSQRFSPAAQLPTMIADPDHPAAQSTMIASDPVQVDSASFAQSPHGMPTGMPLGGPSPYPVMNAQMSEQIARGADVFPSGSYPVPPGTPATPVPAIPSAAPTSPNAQPFPDHGSMHSVLDPSLMSPVGQHYTQQVDWAQAAAAPARALPPWMMIALFVAAIGIALAVTIAIAKGLR
ncbi:MAG: protein kinase [Kofleriaceae bacterium]|nr:protein kinase [Kofleriaceae bacterium]